MNRNRSLNVFHPTVAIVPENLRPRRILPLNIQTTMVGSHWGAPEGSPTWALAASPLGPVGHGSGVGAGVQDQQLVGLDGQRLHLRVVGD